MISSDLATFFSKEENFLLDTPTKDSQKTLLSSTIMSPSNELLEMELLLVQADNLAPKDHNILGRPTTSDPYCIVRFLPQGEYSRPGVGGRDRTMFLGKTPPVMKTLSPKWGQAFQTVVPLHELTEAMFFEVTIMDYDKIGGDDPMGTVQVNVPIRDLGTTTKWYGIPADSAGGEIATGRIQCTLTTKRVASALAKEGSEGDAPAASVISDSPANSNSNSHSQEDDDEDVDDGPIIARRQGSTRASAIRERADRRHAGRRGGHETAEQRRQGRKEQRDSVTDGERPARPRSRVRQTKSAKEETSENNSSATGTSRPRSRVRQTRSVNDEASENGNDNGRPRSRVRPTRSVNDETSGTNERTRARSRNGPREGAPRARKASSPTTSDEAKKASVSGRKEGVQRTRSRNESKQ